jgi:hypothetical protein
MVGRRGDVPRRRCWHIRGGDDSELKGGRVWGTSHGHAFPHVRSHFFGTFGSRMGDVEGGRHAAGAGWTDAAGFRVGGDDEDIQVAGTHFGVRVAVFLARSARGQVA